jgi:hypothetical protein
MKVEIFNQEHLRHHLRDWCEAKVSKYGLGSAYKELRGCRRTAKYVVNGVKFCELHAGLKCLNFMLRKNNERDETGDGGKKKRQTR